jgi:hypothetical protein
MDYTGKRYAHLRFISYSRSGGKGRGSLWLVECDCGTRKEVLARDVTAGRVQTCGSCSYFRGLLSSRSRRTFTRNEPLRRAYRKWLGEITGKGASSTLTPENFRDIVTSPCSYCGTKAEGPSHSVSCVGIGDLYTPETCIALCSKCKALKGRYSHSELLEILAKIYRHQTSLPILSDPT